GPASLQLWTCSTRCERGVKRSPPTIRLFLTINRRCSISSLRPQRLCRSKRESRMTDMFFRRTINAFLLAALLTLCIVAGCNKAANAPASLAAGQSTQPKQDSSQNHAIETETVSPQSIEGAIVATGKILVSEDRMANIGPVHEGRLVRLYAGQGAIVKKGQRLADLQSADLDDAEAEYLKALAEYDNARKTSEAEVRFAQANYDRTKTLYEKTIAPGKNLQAAEHDLQVAEASAESTVASTRAALAGARHRLMILGLKEEDIDALASKPDKPAVFSLTSP